MAAKTQRKEEILQVLARMLESTDGAHRITTAKLAAEVGVSEAALYRHFPSKTAMFEHLIEFIENTMFAIINSTLNKNIEREACLHKIIHMMLTFADKNPGLTRILSGHALVFENERLSERLSTFHERIELQYRNILGHIKVEQNGQFDESVVALLICDYIEGTFLRYVRSNFKKHPLTFYPEIWGIIQQHLRYSPSEHD